MAIHPEGRLQARREAPLHIQLELTSVPARCPESVVSLHGRIVTVFRGHATAAPGLVVEFPIWVCVANNVPTGPAFVIFDSLRTGDVHGALLVRQSASVQACGLRVRTDRRSIGYTGAISDTLGAIIGEAKKVVAPVVGDTTLERRGRRTRGIWSYAADMERPLSSLGKRVVAVGCPSRSLESLVGFSWEAEDDGGGKALRRRVNLICAGYAKAQSRMTVLRREGTRS